MGICVSFWGINLQDTDSQTLVGCALFVQKTSYCRFFCDLSDFCVSRKFHEFMCLPLRFLVLFGTKLKHRDCFPAVMTSFFQRFNGMKAGHSLGIPAPGMWGLMLWSPNTTSCRFSFQCYLSHHFARPSSHPLIIAIVKCSHYFVLGVTSMKVPGSVKRCYIGNIRNSST